MLIEKNVAVECAEKLCASVANGLEVKFHDFETARVVEDVEINEREAPAGSCRDVVIGLDVWKDLLHL